MAHFFKSNKNTAIVETKQGKVRGFVYDGITIFKGIPYARAERFHSPKPVEPWEGVFDATNFGYVCPLLEMDEPHGELLVPHRFWIMNEHCQNLNVWTPGCDGEKRPVLVWFHGGGYEAGSAIEHIAYEGENMSRYGQVVVVSINHRLNILGYLDLSDFGEEYANSGNAGTDDIIASLQWVKENITAFGGDPDNVTVFGQSGGGAKITTLLQTPAADGLFAKGFNMSGVVEDLVDDSKGSGRELAETLMKELGLKSVKELETVSYDRLAEAYNKWRPVFEKAGKYVGCTPHPNAYYVGDPLKVGFRKETAQVPMLVGTVFGEFNTFRANEYDKHEMTEAEQKKVLVELIGKKEAEELITLYKEAYPERETIDLLNLDYVFRYPAQKYIKMRSALNDATYSYMFDLDLPVDDGRAPWHCSDIPYVFHNTEYVPVTQEEGVTEKIEKLIFDSVMAFARTGNPNNEAIPFWPASTPEEEQVLVIGKETQIKCNYDHKLMQVHMKYLKPIMEKRAEDLEVQH